MPTIADLTLARALAAALDLRIVIVAGRRVELVRGETTVATLPTWGEAVAALEAWNVVEFRQMSFLEAA